MSEGRSILYLRREDVEAIDLPIEEVIPLLNEAFEQKGRGEVQMPPKPEISPRVDSTIRAMPAYVPGLNAAGVKWISGYADNHAKGLPNINGLIILNEVETGLPTAIMDCTWITAKRTGASTAVAASHLACRESKTVGIIACGAVGRTNLEALSSCFDLEEVRAFDLFPERSERSADEMCAELGLAVKSVTDLRQAIDEMDIVVSSGPIMQDPEPKIEADWLKPGAFACALDFDSYFKPEVFHGADRLITDDVSQLNYYRSTGYFQQTPNVEDDLGEVVAGLKHGRRSSHERTMSVNLGIALHDISLASRVYQAALEQGLGTELPF